MNSLWTSLLIFVGVVILGVVLYNWRQGRSSNPGPNKAKSNVNIQSTGAADVQVSSRSRREDNEPLLQPAVLPMDDHVSANVGKELFEAPHRPDGPARQQEHAIDEGLDAVVPISLNEPVPGDRLLALTAGLRRAGNKPILVEGAGSKGWQPLTANTSFEALRIGVLLSNRHGALNGVEYSEFVNALQPLGEHLDVMIDPPNLAEVVQRARDLDARCAELDAQVGLNVDSAQAISPALLANFAATQHLQERGNTRYAMVSENAETLFTIMLSNQANRVTFVLDVPRVSEMLTPWAKMVDCAKACAEHLGANIVDDEGRQMNNDSFRMIGEQLGQRYRALANEGFEAGSAAAARVFV